MDRDERRLWGNVLLQALRDLTGIGIENRSRLDVGIASARAWFASDLDDVGSFVWICDLLGFHPDHVRGKVGRLTQGKTQYGRIHRFQDRMSAYEHGLQ